VTSPDHASGENGERLGQLFPDGDYDEIEDTNGTRSVAAQRTLAEAPRCHYDQRDDDWRNLQEASRVGAARTAAFFQANDDALKTGENASFCVDHMHTKK